jgi:prophage regulatory protein
MDLPWVRADIGTWRNPIGNRAFYKRISAVNGVSKTRTVKNASSATPRPFAPNECALRLPQVCKMTGLRRSMIYRMQAENRFPQRIKLTERAVGWLEREVQEWLAQRIENSRGKTPDSS